jgi:putative transposase
MLRQGRSDIARRYWKGTLWSPSYFAGSCGGAPIDIVRRYVEEQRTKTATSHRAVAAALSFPGLNAEVCRANLIKWCFTRQPA